MMAQGIGSENAINTHRGFAKRFPSRKLAMHSAGILAAMVATSRG